MENIEQQKPQSHFVDASITVGDHVYELSAEQARALQEGAYYWHGAGDPSSWLAVAIFLEARRRCGEAGDGAALELAAMSLGSGKLSGISDC